MKFILYLFILVYSFGFSQKKTEQIIAVDSDISCLILDLDHVFNIKLFSTTNSQLIIKSISEGEYANHFVLTKKLENNNLHVSGEIAFTFPNNQDKLSAHKVHAISVEIFLPKHLQTTVFSDIGNITIEGDYRLLTTNSQSGSCYLNNVLGDFVINTINGDINLSSSSRIVKSISKSGINNQEVFTDGKSNFSLKTAKGTINIVKSN